jgi:uncharacterized protein with GYD domain
VGGSQWLAHFLAQLRREPFDNIEASGWAHAHSILNVTMKRCSVITERQAVAFLETSKQGGFVMLYFISANYTPKAMQAMAKKPNTNRRDAVEKLVKAAGGKLVAMYGTMVDGPGAMVIVDADPGVGAAIAAVVASSDGVRNVKAQRLFTMDEVIGIRKIKNRAPEVLQSAR